MQGVANFALRRHGADNSIHIGKVRLCKSAEKNCSEAGSYYSCPACRLLLDMTGSIGSPKPNAEDMILTCSRFMPFAPSGAAYLFFAQRTGMSARFVSGISAEDRVRGAWQSHVSYFDLLLPRGVVHIVMSDIS